MIPSDASLETLWSLQNQVIELIADGRPLEEVAGTICRAAEKLANGVACSILKAQDGRLRHLAGPSLPDSYARATADIPIGANVGTCGSAAYHKTPVLSLNLRTDPRWEGFRELASQLPYRACWSSPVLSKDGDVLATFAFYFPEERGPNAWEREVVGRCSQLISIAIQHEVAKSGMEWLALHDALTGLANRRLFRRTLDRLEQNRTPFALILLDLDGLKSMNDRLGHAAGDAVIREIGRRLMIWAGEHAFRVGGDEFAVIVQGCAGEAQLSATAHRLLATLNGSIAFQATTIRTVMTAGGILYNPSTDLSTFLQNADFALYHAKETNRGGFVPFEQELRTEIGRRQSVLAEVDDALREGRIVVRYQPIVHLQTGEVTTVEALARMVGGDGAIVSAGEFKEAFFDPRISREITDSILRQVAADLHDWLGKGLAIRPVAVNVTTADFQRGDLIERIQAAFHQYHLPLKHLVLEINEAVYLGRDEIGFAQQVHRLREAEVLVALDDFGTGYASLAHLLQFPVDIIKLDRSLVTRVGDERAADAIVSGIMEIAAKLGIRVVAEGVESIEQVMHLQKLGCSLGQGFLYSPAVPASIAGELRRVSQRSPAAATSSSASRPGVRLSR